MITELTPEQEAQLAVYVEKWRKIGLSTEPANRPEAEKGVKLAYELAGLKPPQKIIWFDSPYEMHTNMTTENFVRISVEDLIGASINNWVFSFVGHQVHVKIANMIWNPLVLSVGKSVGGIVRGSLLNSIGSVKDSLYGNHDAHWLGVCDYLYNELSLVNQTKILHGLWRVSQNASWWLPCKEICFISERHTILNLDNEDRPHCNDGIAIGYPDGWGVYAWHGVSVPEDVIMRPHDITPDKIMNEENAEVSRVMIERYGQDNFIRNGGFTKMQSDDYGDLYRVEFDNGDEPIVAVHVQDASTDRDYFLYMPPHIQTAHEGVAWTFGYDNIDDYNPLIET